MDFLPFGEQIAGNAGTTHQFTGYERDGESGLDYASARHYSGTLGRFLIPDPLGIGAASLTNPQTLNQYAYVNGNPMNMVDPSSLDGCDDLSCGGGDFGGGDWGGVPGWGGGVNLGGPIWGEQVPVFNGPLNPLLIIQNWTKREDGTIIGDFPGEAICEEHLGGLGCMMVYWDPDAQMWDARPPKQSPPNNQTRSADSKFWHTFREDFFWGEVGLAATGCVTGGILGGVAGAGGGSMAPAPGTGPAGAVFGAIGGCVEGGVVTAVAGAPLNAVIASIHASWVSRH